MKKVLMILLIGFMATGCTGKVLYIDKFQEDIDGIAKDAEGFPLDHIDEDVDEYIEKRALDINYNYYLKCRDEYESELDYGWVIAENNGVNIEIIVFQDTYKVYDLCYTAKLNDKANLIDEINTMLSFNDYEQITAQQFDSIPVNNTDHVSMVIGKMRYRVTTGDDKNYYVNIGRIDEEDFDYLIEGKSLEYSGFSSVEEAGYLEINEEYYLKCRDEYKSELYCGDIIAQNNDVTITSAIWQNTDKVCSLFFEAKEKDKANLIKEINTMLRLNGYDEITEQQIDGIPSDSTTTIGNLAYHVDRSYNSIIVTLSNAEEE